MREIEIVVTYIGMDDTTRRLYATIDRDGNVDSIAHQLPTKFKIDPPTEDETVFDLLARVGTAGGNVIGIDPDHLKSGQHPSTS
jgi:hypothetical protein